MRFIVQKTAIALILASQFAIGQAPNKLPETQHPRAEVEMHMRFLASDEL